MIGVNSLFSPISKLCYSYSGAVRAALGRRNPAISGMVPTVMVPRSFDQLVGELWAYVQVPRRTKGPRDRDIAVFLPPRSGFMDLAVSGGAPQTS